MPSPGPRVDQPNVTRTSPRTSTPESVPETPPPLEPNGTTTSGGGSSSSRPTLTSPNHSTTKTGVVPIIAGTVGGTLFLIISILGIYLYFHKAPIKPWATGLSCQLQKAFVTGIPKLRRSEILAACEDFSNVIGSSSIGTLYKGTLSSGVEIVVAAVAITSNKDWSNDLELQFRNKIDGLSKVNHKNFINLIGYCEEEEPLTRIMVFEYAPNGTLFEHLHIKESEHLNWAIRLRIAMGMAYCLEHMHQFNPPMVHNHLTSSAIYLSEDYAAKISDFSFFADTTANDIEASNDKLLDSRLALPECNVYSFGVLLFEMITGRLPYLADNNSLENWASDYLSGGQPLGEMVDPTLDSFEEEKLERISEVIRCCVHPDPKQRPGMREVAARLREIMAITPEAATPKLSPLWWAELEISSPDAS